MSDFAKLVHYGGSPEKRDKERKRKRDRYAEDEEYRQRKIEAAKRRYHAKKKTKTKTKPSGRGFNKPKPWMLADGTLTTLVSSGEAASICNLSSRTLAIYEKKGIIPINRILDDCGRRWYPKPFVIWLSELLGQQTNKREPHWKLKRRVERAWQDARAQLPVVLEEPQP